jgi:hypothetical protein
MSNMGSPRAKDLIPSVGFQYSIAMKLTIPQRTAVIPLLSVLKNTIASDLPILELPTIGATIIAMERAKATWHVVHKYSMIRQAATCVHLIG